MSLYNSTCVYGYILTLTVTPTFNWLNDLTNLHNIAFATSASSNIYIFQVFTEKPFSQPLERNLVKKI